MLYKRQTVSTRNIIYNLTIYNASFYHVAYYPKKNRKIFQKKIGHPEGRGRTTPIFLATIKVWYFLNSFNIEKLMINTIFRIVFSNFGHPEGVAQPHPF